MLNKISKVQNGKSRKVVKVSQKKNNFRDFPGSIRDESILRISRSWHPLFKDIIPELEVFTGLCLKISSVYNHLVKHQGVLAGTKRFKQIRLYTLKWMLKLNPEPLDCLSLNRKGFPRDLMFLKEYCMSEEPENLNMVNTILNIPRLSTFRGRLDRKSLQSIYKNIERDDSFKETINQFDLALPKILKNLNIQPIDPRQLGEKFKFHNSNSSGPNSSLKRCDALYSAPYDAKAIVRDKNLSTHLKRVLNDCNQLNIWFYIERLASCVKDDESLTHSKIALIPDPENKQRIVALIDYWSQMCLIPLESHLKEVTLQLPNNHMYDQDRGREIVRKLTLTDEPHSLDGSDFTDRFPKEVQAIVLKHLTNEEYSRNIFKLLTCRNFKVSNTQEFVRYEVGQPMGAHSSFHIANITHSLIAIWSSQQYSKRYDLSLSTVVCGDDIVLSNGRIAKIYLRIMKSLKMTFSEFKGFNSTKDCKISEFCKKLYKDGVLISGFSPNPFLNYSRDYKYVISCIQTASLDREQATPWIIASRHRKKHCCVFDILVLHEIVNGMVDSIRHLPYWEYISEELKDDLESILDLGEHESYNRFGVINILCLHELKEAENKATKQYLDLKRDLDLYSQVPDEKVDIYHPITLKLFWGQRASFRVFNLDTVGYGFLKKLNPTLTSTEVVDIIPTPLIFWYLGRSDPMAFHIQYGQVKDAAKYPVNDFKSLIRSFTNQLGSYEEFRNEMKISIFTGAGTTSKDAVSRLDSSGVKKEAQKQFALCARFRRILNELLSDPSFYAKAKDYLYSKPTFAVYDDNW